LNNNEDEEFGEKIKTYFNELPDEEKQSIYRGIGQVFQTVNEVAATVGKIAKKSAEEIEITFQTLEPLILYYKENKEIFKKIDQWQAITGLSRKQLNEMSIWEAIEIIKKCEKHKRYEHSPSGPVTNAMKMLISSFGKDKVRTSKDLKVNTKTHLTGSTAVNFKSRNSDITLTIDNYSSLASRQDKNTRKIFNFLLQQSNDQHGAKEILFNLNDLVIRGIYANTDTARKGLKTCMQKLTSIKVEGTVKRGKKEIVSSIQVLFTGLEIKNGNCNVSVNDKLDLKFVSQYLTIIPIWTYQLNTVAYDVIDYVFYRARQSDKDIKKDGYFNISLHSLSAHLGQPDPNDTENHSVLIINPILNAITEIEDTQKDYNQIKITPFYNPEHRDAREFLKGHLRIELNEELNSYFIKRAGTRDDEVKKKIKRIESKKTQ